MDFDPTAIERVVAAQNAGPRIEVTNPATLISY